MVRKKKSKYQYVRLPNPEVLKHPTTTIPPVRNFTDKEKLGFRTRLKRVRMWEQFEATLYANRDLNLQRVGPEKALELAWKDTVRRFDSALCRAEERYREGLWKMDYPMMGPPEEWTQDAVDYAVSRLMKARDKGKKPREDWNFWDDMQWVYSRLYDHLLRPTDFPTIEAYNLMASARKDDEAREKFEAKYLEFQKAIVTKRENSRKDEEPEDTSVPEQVPYEESAGVKALEGLLSKLDKLADGASE